MLQIADLHIHSRFSRACSKDLNLKNIELACRIKGVDIIVTGDITHPAWLKEVKSELEPLGNGFFKLKNSDGKIKFVLGTELSCIYKRKEKTRRIHINFLAPSLSSVDKLIFVLEEQGFNLKSDGRPILGLDVEELVKICLDIDEDFFIFPAHIWTPWFSMFGSKSGFDSAEECFGEMTKYIYAIETGLSSDPAMNWRVSDLDKFSIISNSDAHSLQNIGREANIFDLDEISYKSMCDAIKSRDKSKFLKTIEFYPEEGMYHFDGHRNCEYSSHPKDTFKLNGICPKCKRKLTVGVLNRVEELADREEGFYDEKFTPFVRLVGLDKIIAEAFGLKSRKSKKVISEYNKLIQKVGSELYILLDAPIDVLKQATTDKIVEGIELVRQGKVFVKPGFDGQYGVVKVFNEENKVSQQQTLL